MLISAEESEQAVAAASRLLLTHSDDARGYFLRGLAYLLDGDNDFAVSSFDRALELRPEDRVTLAYRGMAHERARRFEAAEADLRAAINLGADTVGLYFVRLNGLWNTNIHRRLGTVLMELDRPDAALVEIERARDLEPENHFMLLDRARARLAAGLLDGAWDDAMTLAGLMPQMPGCYDIMGRVRWWQGRYDEAVGLHQRAVDRTMTERGTPGAGGGAFLANLARAEALAGRARSAMLHIEKAIQHHREHPVASDYLLLGVLLHDAGRPAESAGAFRRAAELDDRLAAGGWDSPRPSGAAPATAAFLDRQRNLAEAALGGRARTGTAAAAVTSPRAVIDGVTVTPSPVPAGHAFDFHIDYTVTDPAMPAGPIPANLEVEILEGGAVVFSSPTEEFSATNGSRSSWVHHMNPTTATGDFTVRIRISCRGAEDVSEAAFRIE